MGEVEEETQRDKWQRHMEAILIQIIYIYKYFVRKITFYPSNFNVSKYIFILKKIL